MKICQLIIILLLLGGSSGYAAENLAASFENGNRAYELGKFEEAVKIYQGILKNGTSPALEYNLANAFLKADRIGEAVLHYRRALLLDPGMRTARENLRFAREKAQANGSANFFESVSKPIRPSTLAWVASFLFWAWHALLSFRKLVSSTRNRFSILTSILGIFALASVFWFGTVTYARHLAPNGVVTSTNAVARLGPLEEAKVAYPLTAGSEVQIIGNHNGWFQVRNSRQEIGWLNQAQIQRLF
ncbi:MAG: SH3 domain-containing protein [Verrucomicrobiota bacterium]|nr:SH3 domain-containing protein [Verrucomicrobiota bacterium]